MKKRTPKEWQRLVAAYERGFESRGDFGERYGLATSTLGCKPQIDSMPSSKLAKACAYVLGQWPKRTRVFAYGEVELVTHWAEPERSGDGQPIGCPKGEAKPSQNSVRPLARPGIGCMSAAGRPVPASPLSPVSSNPQNALASIQGSTSPTSCHAWPTAPPLRFLP